MVRLLLRLTLNALLIVSFLLGSTVVEAQTAQSNPFKTDLELKYTISDEGVTTVEHHYTITNTTPTTFLNKYALKTSFRRLKDVQVLDSEKSIQPNIAETESGTSIGISFPTEAVGEGKTRDFTIRYTTTDIAVVGGNALEVHIPQLAELDSYNSVKLQVITPVRFGTPVHADGLAIDSSQNAQAVTTSITNPGSAFSLLFGDTQYYFLSLRYHLENTTSSPGITQVALPPDTSFQRMHYHSIEPMPDRLERDVDGNWIATYTLPASGKTTLHLSAVAKIQLEPDPNVPVVQPTRKHQTSQTFWETNDSYIKELAEQHTTPKKIYDYVADTLQYSLDFQADAPERKGAVAAFKQPEQAVCQEFADAFITLSRTNDIPARRLTGYAYTQDAELRPLSFAGDILHAWPEYYDSERKIWTPVDPTWGNTTRGVDYFSRFDLNHIVFAINGVSSTIPYPAGAYKTESLESKDIEVSFATEFPKQEQDLTVSVEKAQLFGIPIPGQYIVVLHNQSGQAWYDMAVDVGIASLPDSSIRYSVPYLLPFQIRRIPVTLQSAEWLGFARGQTGRVTIHSANNAEIYYDREVGELTTSPKALTPLTSLSGAVVLGVVAVTATLGTGSLLVLGRRKRRSLRR